MRTGHEGWTIKTCQTSVKNTVPTRARQTPPAGVRGSHQTALLIGQQHRQAIRHHDGAGDAGRVCDAAVGLCAGRRLPRQPDGSHAMHLRQKHRPRVHRPLENGAIGSHMREVIADVLTQVQCVVGRRRHAASARAAQRTHTRRCRPLGNKPVGVHVLPCFKLGSRRKRPG